MSKILNFDPNEKPTPIENDTKSLEEKIEDAKESIKTINFIIEFSKQAFARGKFLNKQGLLK